MIGVDYKKIQVFFVFTGNDSFQNRRAGVVVRAFASQSVDLGFNPFVESYQMVFTPSLLGARHLGEVAENKPTSFLVVSLGKALNGTPPPLCGRQVAQFSL